MYACIYSKFYIYMHTYIYPHSYHTVVACTLFPTSLLYPPSHPPSEEFNRLIAPMDKVFVCSALWKEEPVTVQTPLTVDDTVS